MTEKFCKGPEQIRPADSFWTTDPASAVKLKVSKDSAASRQPISVPGLLSRVAREYPSHAALCYKNLNNEWTQMTYR